MNFIIYRNTKMEDFKKGREGDKEIVFSKSIKAGKRIYYVDVKKNRKEELFIALTESKKIVSGDAESPSINFEKHKIFLYQEDLSNFMNGLEEAINYIRANQEEVVSRQEEEKTSNDIKLDIDF